MSSLGGFNWCRTCPGFQQYAVTCGGLRFPERQPRGVLGLSISHSGIGDPKDYLSPISPPAGKASE